MTGAVGSVLQKRLAVCGGQISENKSTTSDCYHVSNQGTASVSWLWKENIDLLFTKQKGTIGAANTNRKYYNMLSI